MALFESYERRINKINGVLAQYGISSVEECREICKAKGFAAAIRRFLETQYRFSGTADIFQRPPADNDPSYGSARLRRAPQELLTPVAMTPAARSNRLTSARRKPCLPVQKDFRRRRNRRDASRSATRKRHGCRDA